MSDPLHTYDYLLPATGPAAITLQQWLRPDNGEVIYPPTYANPSQRKGDPPVYNIDRFPESGQSVCVIDSIPSQANRIEPMLGRLRDKEGNPIRLLPNIIVTAKGKTKDGEDDQTANLLEAGHRAADAMIQLSSLRADLLAAIKAYGKGDAVPLAKIAPTSLVFGMWDSRESGAKVPRLLNSIIRAYDVQEHHRSAQFNPAIDFEAAGVAPGKGEKKLSEAGMAGAPATFQHGGVSARGGIRREASLNLCTLRDIVATDTNQTLALQRYLLGLGLVALTYLDGKALNLRQGCLLVGVPDKPMKRVAIYADGTEKPLELDPDTALGYAKAAADAFGVGPDRLDIVFDPKLAKEALKKTTKEEAGN